MISIHALLAESDLSMAAVCQAVSAISIHALLAESDQMYVSTKILEQIFLSTLSLRRATRPFSVFIITIIEISIHALLAESDYKAEYVEG